MRRTLLRIVPILALLAAALVGCVNNDTGKGTTESSGKENPITSAAGVSAVEVRAAELQKAIKTRREGGADRLLGNLVQALCGRLPSSVERHKKYAEQGLCA